MDFKIPKGKEFVFRLKIYDADSFLPQDLTTLDNVNTSITLQKLSDLTDVVGTITFVVDGDPLDGWLLVTIPDTMTSILEYERGDKVDGYYSKPMYQAVADIQFSDATPSRVAIIQSIKVVPTGAA